MTSTYIYTYIYILSKSLLISCLTVTDLIIPEKLQLIDYYIFQPARTREDDDQDDMLIVLNY